MEIQYPAPPEPSLMKLRSFPVNTGQVITSYIINVMKVAVPPDFRANCEKLDKLREQLRTCNELPQEMYQSVSDYVHLLKIITSGFDLSERPGFSLRFPWGNDAKNEIDYEITCMCYNLCVGLLLSNSKIQPNDFTLKQLVPQIKAAKSLQEQISECWHESYNKAIPRQIVTNLEVYITTVFYQIQHSLFVTMKKSKIIPKSSMFVAKQFQVSGLPVSEYVNYYKAVTSIIYAISFYENKDYGQAVAHARKAMSLIPDSKSISTNTTQFGKLWRKLRDQFKPLAEKYDNENKTLFFDKVPAIDSLPSLEPTPVVGNIKWDEYQTKVSPFGVAIDVGFESTVDNKLNEFRAPADKALDDIKNTVAALPKNTIPAIDQKHSELLKLKSEANALSQQAYYKFNQKQQSVSMKFPDITRKIPENQNSLSKAYQTDVFYETQFAQAQSIYDTFGPKITKLQTIKETIGAIIASANAAADEAKRYKDAPLQEGMTAMQNLLNEFASLNYQLNPLLNDAFNVCNECKTMMGTTVAQFSSLMSSADIGFTNGISCYQKLITNFKTICSYIDQC